MAGKVDVAKFDSKNNFDVWKFNVRGLLSYNQVLIVLETNDHVEWGTVEENGLN